MLGGIRFCIFWCKWCMKRTRYNGHSWQLLLMQLSLLTTPLETLSQMKCVDECHNGQLFLMTLSHLTAVVGDTVTLYICRWWHCRTWHLLLLTVSQMTAVINDSVTTDRYWWWHFHNWQMLLMTQSQVTGVLPVQVIGDTVKIDRYC